MQIKAIDSFPRRWMYAIERIRYEIQLSWLVIKSDFSATIVPTFLFTIAAWKSTSGSPSALAAALGSGLLYFWLYVMTFCLANQLIGVDEDRINKPYRPLVTGMISTSGAMARWVALMLLFSIVGWWLHLLEWVLLWQAAIVLHNFGGWSRHWFGKHLLMSVGVVAGLGPAWELVAPLTPDSWRWIMFLACVILPLIATQDLRDVTGDQAIGRRTAPIVFGERRTRLVLSLGFALLPIAVHAVLMAPGRNVWSVLLCDLFLAILSLWIAVRLLLFRTREDDQTSYMLFTYWYCYAMLSAIVVL